MNRSFLFVALGLTAASLALGWAMGRRHEGRTSQAVSRGQLLYEVNCASCHGLEGKGDGTAAAQLRPPPRDFAARPWRFPVTRESIRKVTLDGIPGTAMPASKSILSGRDVDAVVDYVYGLAMQAPAETKERTPEQRRLDKAGFIELRGTDPPKLALVDAADKKISLADFRGKNVLLHFWGTGCAHCIKEMPSLNALQKRLQDRVVVLHVCVDEDDARIAQALLDRLAPGTTALVESTGLGVARFEVDTLPTAWLISPEGKAIARTSGARDWNSPAIEAIIQ